MLPLAVALAATVAAAPPPQPSLILSAPQVSACRDIDPAFVRYVAPPAHHPGANPMAWLVSGPPDNNTIVIKQRSPAPCLTPLTRTSLRLGATADAGR